MEHIKRLAVIGCGQRGRDAYGGAVLQMPDRAKIVAIADPDPARRDWMARLHQIPEAFCFDSGEALLAQPKLADAVLVTTQDQLHVRFAIPALEKGYDVLMEKPVSPDLEECQALLEVYRRTGRKVVVCHPMRYSPLYRKVKEILDSGILGRLITIQGIENIGYWHFAHSYVRGNWRRTDESSPMLLAKCCHDTDMLVWLTGKRCQSVSSMGQLTWFKEENAPEGAGMRCFNCAVQEQCPYDAEKMYLTRKDTGLLAGVSAWCNVLVPEPTEEKVRKALEEGPYGRCVYHCDNDVADNQVLNLQFEDGITVGYSASAFTDAIWGRYIRIMGSMGDMVIGGKEQYLIRVKPFGREEIVYDLRNMKSIYTGHGGGDLVLMSDFLDCLDGKVREGISTLDESMEGHFIAFAAEKSRLNGGQVVPMTDIRP